MVFEREGTFYVNAGVVEPKIAEVSISKKQANGKDLLVVSMNIDLGKFFREDFVEHTETFDIKQQQVKELKVHNISFKCRVLNKKAKQLKIYKEVLEKDA